MDLERWLITYPIIGSKMRPMTSRFGIMQVQNQYIPIMQAYHLPGTYDSNFFAYVWSEFINGTVAHKDLRTLEYKHVRVDGEYDSPVRNL